MTQLADLAPCFDEAAARLLYVLRSRVLARMATPLRERALEVLLVKGAALALTVYPRAWAREMSDVDILVRPGTKARVVGALVDAGFERAPVAAGRILTSRALETVLFAHVGAAKILVEVHTQLDKIGLRPVDYEAIFARAAAAPALAGLLLPSDEDQLLLVVLHAACAEFRHPVGFVDLDALLARGVDLGAVSERARAWQLRTALFVALSTLRALGSAHVTDALIDAFAPSQLRRAALSHVYDVGSYPVARGDYVAGLTSILRQAPLREDGASWLSGAFGFACLRAAERVISGARWPSR